MCQADEEGQGELARLNPISSSPAHVEFCLFSLCQPDQHTFGFQILGFLACLGDRVYHMRYNSRKVLR